MSPTMQHPPGQHASAHRACGFLDDPRRLWDERFCLLPVSKNVKGRIDPMHQERQRCEEPECVTLKVHQSLRLQVATHQACDSEPSLCLDGALVSTDLVHALYDGDPQNRGPHTATFTLYGDGCEVVGELSGMTNVGTHRQPPFDPCQECHAPGWMEGRLCGRIVKSKHEHLLGCRIVGAYRFKLEPKEECDQLDVRGTIEATIVCPCTETRCVDFTGFAPAEHPNPWEIAGAEFHVFDHRGAPTATTRVWDGGTGGPMGLDAGWTTRIRLDEPTNQVTVRLITYASPPAVIAVDAGGNVVDSAVVSASGVVETIVLGGPGIAGVIVRSPQNETLILGLCVQT